MQNLRALRQALATLEGLPSELVGRVNASGKWNFRQMMSPDKGQGGPQQQQRLLTLEGASSSGGGSGAGAAGSPSKAPSAALGYGRGGAVSSAGRGPLANGAGTRRPATAGQMQGQGSRSGGQYAGSPR